MNILLELPDVYLKILQEFKESNVFECIVINLIWWLDSLLWKALSHIPSLKSTSKEKIYSGKKNMLTAHIRYNFLQNNISKHLHITPHDPVIDSILMQYFAQMLYKVKYIMCRDEINITLLTITRQKINISKPWRKSAFEWDHKMANHYPFLSSTNVSFQDPHTGLRKTHLVYTSNDKTTYFRPRTYLYRPFNLKVSSEICILTMALDT